MSVQPQSHSTKPLQVFLCHAAVDKPKVKKLGQWLHDEGFNPWPDKEDLLAGNFWEQKIKRAIRAASVVLVCLSHTPISQDGYVHKQIELALEVAKEKLPDSIFLIPVRLEECELPERLHHLKPANLFEERGYEQLRKALQHRAAQLKTTPNVREALQDIRGVTRTKQQLTVIPPGFSKQARPPDQNVSYEQELTEPEELKPVEVSLTTISPPAGEIRMYIQMDGPDACYILLAHTKKTQEGKLPQEGELLKTASLPRPHGIKRLDEFGSTHHSPHAIVSSMHFFSEPQREICRHLSNLHKQFTDQGYLFIYDCTDFEIPWEMFCVNLDDQEYLGTMFTTARLPGKVDQELIGNYAIDIKAEECTGSVVAFVPQSTNAGRELDYLQNDLNAKIDNHAGDFLHHLQREDGGVGLVYVAGRGIFDSKLQDKVGIGLDQNGVHELGLVDLWQARLELLQTSRCIVFLNAWHSGRLGIYNWSSEHQGFVTRFLQQGARGVIGTLGEFSDNHASDIAHELLRNCYANPGKSVATLLRELRQEAVKRIKGNPTPENWLHFIYTFMYIYYGNPMTVLRLTKREG